MTDIIRVWGTCDNIQIEFNYEGGTAWSCKVPPDFKDGIYVAEFWAQDTKGRIGHWSGFLYMSSGICHFKFKEERYQLWIEPQNYQIRFEEEDEQFYFDFNTNNWTFEFSKIKEKPFKVFFCPQNYIIDFNKNNEKKYYIDIKEDKYDIEIIENKKDFNRQIDKFLKTNLYQRLLFKKTVKNIVQKTSAILGKAILGVMILGKKDDTIDSDSKSLYYQIKFNTDNCEIEFLDSNYKIFIEKRCEHWEL